MKDTKGLSHVEMIVSFGLFVIFLLLLLSFFNPLKKSGDNALINVLENSVKAKSEINVITSTLIVKADATISENCFGVEKVAEGIVVVRKEERVNATNSNNLYILSSNSGVYNLLFSDFFSENPSPVCQLLAAEDYNFGVTRENKFIFIRNLNELEAEYYSDYNKLKKDLSLPAQNDFEFSVSLANQNIIAKGARNEPNINIESKNINIKIIDENASIQQAILNLRIW